MNGTEDKTYNGWTNYETWLVKLWIDNEQSTQSYWLEEATGFRARYSPSESVRNLAAELKDQFENGAEGALPGENNAFWRDLLNSALAEVNWGEIAKSLLEDLS